MKKKIMEKISDLRKVIVAQPYGKLSQDLERESKAAMFAGMGEDEVTPEWKTYMKNFCSNADQLSRLCGEDKLWLNDQEGYGKSSLSYLVGGGPCGGGTCLFLAVSMKPEYAEYLDDGVSGSSTDPGECNPIPPEVRVLQELEMRLKS